MAVARCPSHVTPGQITRLLGASTGGAGAATAALVVLLQLASAASSAPAPAPPFPAQRRGTLALSFLAQDPAVQAGLGTNSSAQALQFLARGPTPQALRILNSSSSNGSANAFLLGGNRTLQVQALGGCGGDLHTECEGADDTCVSKADQTWSQCINCKDTEGFQEQCVAWDSGLRLAAVVACGIACPAQTSPEGGGMKIDRLTNVTTPVSGCASTREPCADGLTCVSKADGTWSKCIDCQDREQFGFDCQYWDPGLIFAAVVACGLPCPVTEKPAHECEGLTCAEEELCVSKLDGTWSQCVDCSEEHFQQDCRDWGPNFRYAAVKACSVPCQDFEAKKVVGECSNHSLPPVHCEGNRTCVAKEDGTWNQCVDCSRQSGYFQEDCHAWDDGLREAAERTCGIVCAPETPAATTTEESTTMESPETTQNHAAGCGSSPKPCPTGSTCVQVDAAGSPERAQCLDCSDEDSFQAKCPQWEPSFQAAAILACGSSCVGKELPEPPPENTQTPLPALLKPVSAESRRGIGCNRELPCEAPSTCVSKPDGTWSECIDCLDAPAFQRNCPNWEEAFRTSAIKVCGRPCGGATITTSHAQESSAKLPWLLSGISAGFSLALTGVFLLVGVYRSSFKVKDEVQAAQWTAVPQDDRTPRVIEVRVSPEEALTRPVHQAPLLRELPLNEGSVPAAWAGTAGFAASERLVEDEQDCGRSSECSPALQGVAQSAPGAALEPPQPDVEQGRSASEEPDAEPGRDSRLDDEAQALRQPLARAGPDSGANRQAPRPGRQQTPQNACCSLM